MIQLRQEIMAADRLPYPHDWPLPPCPVCRRPVQKWVSSSDARLPLRFRFGPCGHGIVADQPPG
ncbi:hypothetical protein [Streptomyces sp. NPDC087297]|uniref:hypothetical protein n=1 Tax=Streptomyces sp. NPDC087297 TaxID=3365778 RepID=UPI0037F45811